jgi:hypothetical protein
MGRSAAEAQQFHNSRLQGNIASSRLPESRFQNTQNTNNRDDLDRETGYNITKPTNQFPRAGSLSVDDIPAGNLASPEQLDSLVNNLNAEMNDDKAKEYGERLGAYLNQKINEGSFMAFLISFIFALSLDTFDITIGLIGDFGLPILGTIFTWIIKSVLYVAMIFLIRHQLSFFKRGLVKLLIRVIIIPLFIEAIPILGSLTPTYTIMMIYIYRKHRKELTLLNDKLFEVNQLKLKLRKYRKSSEQNVLQQFKSIPQNNQ